MNRSSPPTMGVSRSEVRIQSFVPSIAVISSKQRPRKILIVGSDGNEHTFLLKGHEDLRQDERVMQLFGLTNALLANHRDTSKRDLAIRRYAGKYSKRKSEHREWSTVVDISTKPPSFKLVPLSLPRSPQSKTPKQVFF